MGSAKNGGYGQADKVCNNIMELQIFCSCDLKSATTQFFLKKFSLTFHSQERYIVSSKLRKAKVLTFSLPESNLESINVILTFKSVDETLVCDHSNESY